MFFLLGHPEGQSSAHVKVSGNPFIDSEINLKVRTHNQTYNLTLQKLYNQILHSDLKVLSISTDKDGKTLFHEDTRPVSVMFSVTVLPETLGLEFSAGIAQTKYKIKPRFVCTN